MKVHNVPHAVPLSHMVDDFSFLLIHPGVTDNLTLCYFSGVGLQSIS